MDPVSLTLMAASLGGGLMQLGHKKAKSISPEWLKQHFGAGAVTDEMVQLFNHVLNSPVGQKMTENAATQGQQFQTDMSRRAAASGMGPAGGAESGASIFSQAASGGATNALQRGVQSDIYAQTMPAAQQMVSDRMGIAAQSEQNRLNMENAQPSTMEALGGMISRGANAALAAPAAGQPTSQLGSGANAYQSTLKPSPLLSNVNPGRGYMFPSGYKQPGFFSRLGRGLRGGMQRLVTPGIQ